MLTPLSLHVPGKLMLAGEWNILLPGSHCLTLPTKGILFSLEEAEQIFISSPLYNLSQTPYHNLTLHSAPAGAFLHTLIHTALTIVKQNALTPLPFHLSLNNDPATYVITSNTLHKIGVGSSACTAVGIIKIITQAHGIQLDTHSLFKLAVQAHYQAQQKAGSGFDVAAAAACQAILYRKQSVLEESDIFPISLPSSWKFAVGFSGVSASTPALIKIFEACLRTYPQRANKILNEIEKIVLLFFQALKNEQLQEAMHLLTANREYLKQLSALCDNALETPPLTRMIDIANSHGSAAKFSGAGGGDCVIALCPSDEVQEKIYKAWEAAGFIAARTILLPPAAAAFTTKNPCASNEAAI